MGKAKQAKKARTCRVCEGTFETTAREIKTHAATCKGKK